MVATLVDKGNYRIIFSGLGCNEGNKSAKNIVKGRMIMMKEVIAGVFTPEYLQQLFPENRANDFFEALLGDADEGAYDISLAFRGSNENTIQLELLLKERPGHCLACNLTQGLPTVFSRHPVINVQGVVDEIEKSLNGKVSCSEWSLGYTQQKSSGLHAIPLTISIS